MKRYIVIPINKMIVNSDIFYSSDDINESYLEYLYQNESKLNRCCIIDTKDMKIVGGNSIRTQLFIIYKYNTFIGAYENKHLVYFINKKNRNYLFYNYKGEIILPTNNSKENSKKKNAVSIEIEDFDKLSDLEQVKLLEKYLTSLRKEFPNIKINDDKEFLKNVRFTVRKSFEEKEKDFYTDFETAELSCPVGYCVFDVLTGNCVYVKEKSIYDFKNEAKEGMKYKKAWNELHKHVQTQFDKLRNDSGSVGSNMRTAYHLILNAMNDFEGEIINNE